MIMPGKSGIDVLELIRGRDKEVAIIVSTAYPTLDTAIASVKHQASDYVRKPIDPPTFLATIYAALARKGLTVQAEVRLHQAIGEVIRGTRKTKGLTLKQFSRRSGLSLSLLSQVERGMSSPTVSALYRMANALGLRDDRSVHGILTLYQREWRSRCPWRNR